MSRYEIRQLGDRDAYDAVEIDHQQPDEARYLAIFRAALLAHDRRRCYAVTFVDTNATPPVVQEIGRLGVRYTPAELPVTP